MTTETPAADRQVAADLAAAREAVENLVNLFFDRVSIGELTADPESGREQLAECIHEGLSDEWTRLYRIAAVPARRILGATEQADTETAPAVDRAATLHEAADVLDQRAAGLEALSSSSFGEESFAARELTEQAGRLRRLAAEAQQPTPAPAEAVPAVFADGGVNDIRELYAVHEAITASGGQLTHHVHRAVDALRAVWDRELRREQQRNARRPTP